MMDLQGYSFSAVKFEASILGQCLKMWSILPDSYNIHKLYNKSPLQATYQWFASLQQLLMIKQNWVKRLHYHRSRDFEYTQ
jgi:hypothetical protein